MLPLRVCWLYCVASSLVLFGLYFGYCVLLDFVAMAILTEFPEKLVQCSDMCKMWIEFVNSGILCSFVQAASEDFVFKCDKCVRVKELEDLVSKCSCRPQEVQWTVVDAIGNAGDVVVPVLSPVRVACVPAVPLVNSFNGLPVEDCLEEAVVLEEEVVRHTDDHMLKFLYEDLRDVSIVSEDVNSSVDSGRSLEPESKSEDKIVLCGDSLVRHVDKEFCKVDRSNRIRICRPGAKIQDVSRDVREIVSDAEIVVVHVGTNNLQSDPLYNIRTRYRELFCRLDSTRAKVVFSSLLPRFDEKVSAGVIELMNVFLEELCSEFGFKFLDLFSTFQARGSICQRWIAPQQLWV